MLSPSGSSGGVTRRGVDQGATLAVRGPAWPHPPLARPDNGAVFERGVAIHNMLNWAAVEPLDPRRYSWPPFIGANYETSDMLLRNVARAGFDFIRLTVDPGPFLQFADKKRDALDQHLIDVVRRLLAYGFAVIVDFHPNTHVADYAPERLVQALDAPLFLSYVEVIRRTPSLLASFRTSMAALDLRTEPHSGGDPPTTERWQRMLEQLHGAARTAAPDLLVVLTGARGGDAKGLIALNPAPFVGSNVLFSFHYYSPYDF